jgi:hypothetical protein
MMNKKLSPSDWFFAQYVSITYNAITPSGRASMIQTRGFIDDWNDFRLTYNSLKGDQIHLENDRIVVVYEIPFDGGRRHQ